MPANTAIVYAHILLVIEFAENGSLYSFVQVSGNTLDFSIILQWAKEIALGKY